MKKINGKMNPADLYTKYLPETDSFDSKEFNEKFEECDGDWDLVAESENQDEGMSVALIRHAASL